MLGAIAALPILGIARAAAKDYGTAAYKSSVYRQGLSSTCGLCCGRVYERNTVRRPYWDLHRPLRGRPNMGLACRTIYRCFIWGGVPLYAPALYSKARDPCRHCGG